MEAIAGKVPSASDREQLAEKRAQMAAAEMAAVRDLGPISPSVNEAWTDITLPSGFVSKTLVIRPAKPRAPGPLIVLFHGGGFTVGTPAMMTRPGREFAEHYGATVVSPTYKFVPENPWPAGPESAWEMLVWLSHHAPELYGVDLDRGFVVGGMSAGASNAAICAGVSLSPAVEKQGRLAGPITGVFACCPMLLADHTVPDEYRHLWTSRVDNKDAPFLNAETVESIWRLVNPDFQSPWTSPFNTLTAAAKDSPRYYIQVGHLDALRDDGIVFEKALAARGFDTRIDIFPEDGHASWCAFPSERLSKNPTMEEATMSGMKWLLRKDE